MKLFWCEQLGIHTHLILYLIAKITNNCLGVKHSNLNLKNKKSYRKIKHSNLDLKNKKSYRKIIPRSLHVLK